MEAVAAKATQVATTKDKAGSGQHRQLGAQRSIETQREIIIIRFLHIL